MIAPQRGIWTRWCTVAASLALLVLSACAGEEVTPGVAAEVDTLPSGIVQVRNPPPDPATSPRWRLDTDVVIGTSEGEGPALFGQLRGATLLPDGRIVVLEALAQEVRIFGADGRHLRTFGGQGEGPGEFTGANGLLVGPDGSIRVHDTRNARLTFLDPDTGFVEAVPLEIQRTGYLWNAAMDSLGRIYEPTLAGDFDERWEVVKVYDAGGSWVDTIRIEPYEFDRNAENPSFYRYERGASAVPFWPRGGQAVDPRGFFWTGTPDVNVYRIAQTTFRGDTVRVFESHREPLPVRPEEREAAIEMIRGRTDEALDWSRIPDEKPIIEGIVLDDRGRVWVRVNASDSLTTFDVYGRDGVYQGTAVSDLAIPAYWSPAIRGDVMVAMITDEFDVPYVVRARVREVR